MCHQCDYKSLLQNAGLEATSHRLHVLAVVGDSDNPLSARDIYQTIRRSHSINRVTVYRILDALVQQGLVNRLSGGDRAFFYGLAPNANHAPHPHFFCRRCKRMDCLHPESIPFDLKGLKEIFPGQIDNVEVRVDGLCSHCLGER